MMRHVKCILLLQCSTTSQRLWVFRISVPYAQKDPRFLFTKKRGQPWELWSLVSTVWKNVYEEHEVTSKTYNNFFFKVMSPSLSPPPPPLPLAARLLLTEPLIELLTTASHGIDPPSVVSVSLGTPYAGALSLSLYCSRCSSCSVVSLCAANRINPPQCCQ